jgi:hypothetical protein
MSYLGDFVGTETIPIPITTNDGSGGRVEPSTAFEVADIRVYKGVSATQRSSEAGFAIAAAFDSMVGVQMFSIDLSDNTDAGFFAAGNDYSVILYPDETVDTQNISKVIATFSIQNRYMRGTASAALASVCTETRLAELDAANLPADIDAIKVPTDKLVFTVANKVDANVTNVAGVAITGAGVETSDEWRPA